MNRKQNNYEKSYEERQQKINAKLEECYGHKKEIFGDAVDLYVEEEHPVIFTNGTIGITVPDEVRESWGN